MRASAANVSFQLAEYGSGGVGVDTQHDSQVPGRGKPLARNGLTVTDRPAQCRRHLFMQGDRDVRVDPHGCFSATYIDTISRTSRKRSIRSHRVPPKPWARMASPVVTVSGTAARAVLRLFGLSAL